MAHTDHVPRPFGVLVVDDEADVRELLAEYFREQGCEVGSAADGRAAIVAVEREPARYQLILVDLNLPGADGLTVLKAARKANPNAYVVIITGYASLDTAIQAVRLGAYDYLTKPFSMGQIEVIFQRVADRLELEAENRHLTRQLSTRSARAREASDRPVSLAARLDDIDARLQRIEALVRTLAERPLASRSLL